MTAIEESIGNIRVNYHRNGVGGERFYTIHFVWLDPTEPYCSGNLIATVIPYEDSCKNKLKCNGRCYVVNPADPEQCYRGDHFELVMRKIMEAHDIDWHERTFNPDHWGCVSKYSNFQAVREIIVKNAKEKNNV